MVTGVLSAQYAVVSDELIFERRTSPAVPVAAAGPSARSDVPVRPTFDAVAQRRLWPIVDVVLLPCQAGFALFYRPGH
jgi:hypothetical protein